MKLKIVTVGPLRTNCYFVINEDTKETIIIDPAFEEGTVIDDALQEDELKPVAIFLTHGHVDHFGSINRIADKYNIPSYSSQIEAEYAANFEKSISVQIVGEEVRAKITNIIDDGDIIKFAGMSFECIAVPGHSENSICYYNREDKVLFSGDTLFNSCIGRMDFYTGPYGTLITKIKEKLMVLPEDTTVFPGHGASTNIEYEKENNTYLK